MGRLYVKRATNHVAEEGSAAMVLSGVGVGGQASVFVEPGGGVSLGVSYKSRALVPLEGDADFNLPSAFAADYPDQHVTSEVTLPDRIAFGLGATVGPVRLAFDATLTLWGVNEELAFDFEHEATPDRVQPNDWRHTFALRGGVEYTPLEELAVRAGLYGDGIAGAPPPDETLAPSSPDAPRVALTLGASAHPTPWLWIDAFYEHLWLLERASTSPDAPVAGYHGSGNLFGFALRTAFDPFAEPEPEPAEPEPCTEPEPEPAEAAPEAAPEPATLR
ncbi:MAG: outer membrane protein transport protein [Polyangiaceae bacterium]|nr:outer membrane protein transport protein [Polyangiaceae bacterium]